MTRTEAAKNLGILQDRSQWWLVQIPEGRQLLRDLGRLDMKSALRFNRALASGEWIDSAGVNHVVSKEEVAKIPGVVRRLTRSAMAHLILSKE